MAVLKTAMNSSQQVLKRKVQDKSLRQDSCLVHSEQLNFKGKKQDLWFPLCLFLMYILVQLIFLFPKQQLTGLMINWQQEKSSSAMLQNLTFQMPWAFIYKYTCLFFLLSPITKISCPKFGVQQSLGEPRKLKKGGQIRCFFLLFNYHSSAETNQTQI